MTHIDGTGLSTTAEGIFLTNTNTYFSSFDIFGAPTPAVGTGSFCPGNSNCGKAFSIRGSGFTIQSIDCHDNGGNCIGGGGSANVTVDDLDCYHNGNAYSMTSSFIYAGCVKRVAAYAPGNNTTITNSYIHDNPFIGLWCDYCKYGLFDIENNVITNNGGNGVQWEVSGGWGNDDRAIIKNNTFSGNNRVDTRAFMGQVHVSTANNVLITGNTFGAGYTSAIGVLYDPSRSPPLRDSRGVVITGNSVNGHVITGCNLSGVSCSGNS